MQSKHFNFLNKLSFVFICVIVFFNNSFSQTSTTVSLNKNWQFKFKDKWYNTEVPNSIHTDLLNNKLIEDPFYRDNEFKLQWIDSMDWEYKKEFDVDATFLKKQNVEINFKGLDTYADVYLNDKLILQADNMFREWKISCKQNLRTGKNNLKIIFHSASKKTKELYENYSYKKLPGEERIMARKAQYHFGWDFAPRFVTCGIWKDVELVGWDNCNIENIYFQTDSIMNRQAFIHCTFQINSSADSHLRISIIDKNSKEKIIATSEDVKKENHELTLRFKIGNPQLWWCNGSGQQHEYDFSIYVQSAGGEIFSTEKKFGVRTIELIQQPDSAGKNFYFKLNGIPVFMKGANYIPQDVFLNRVTNDKYDSLLKSVKDANMNMLRVWGGGIYEKEKFYELCDQYGILVWQDFMFACGMYPFDETFLQNVKEEAEQPGPSETGMRLAIDQAFKLKPSKIIRIRITAGRGKD